MPLSAHSGSAHPLPSSRKCSTSSLLASSQLRPMRVVSNFDSLRLVSLRHAPSTSKGSLSNRATSIRMISTPLKSQKSDVSFVRAKPSPQLLQRQKASLPRSHHRSRALSIYANRSAKKVLRSSLLSPLKQHNAKIAMHISKEHQKRPRLASINGRLVQKLRPVSKAVEDISLPGPSSGRLVRQLARTDEESQLLVPNENASISWQLPSSSSSQTIIFSPEKIKPSTNSAKREEISVEENKQKAMQLYRKVWKISELPPLPANGYDSGEDEEREEELRYFSKMERLEKQVLRKHNIWENEQRYRAALLKKPVEGKSDWSNTYVTRGK